MGHMIDHQQQYQFQQWTYLYTSKKYGSCVKENFGFPCIEYDYRQHL